MEEFIKELGVHHFGAALVPIDLRPFPHLPYAVSLGVPLSKTVVSSIRNGPTYTYFHHYRTTNAYLDSAALQLMLFIEQQGKNAVYIPASQTVDSEDLRGLFSHKMAAVLSGLGGIGQNALFISNRFGPALRLSTVLTDYPVKTASPVQNPCTNCARCVKACPSGALTGEAWYPGIPRDELIDAKKCSLHMKKAYRHIGRGAVCGICVAVCPLCNAE
jgi:epoxyqueuosine reductase QueG